MEKLCAVCCSDRDDDGDDGAAVVPLRLARCEHEMHLSCLARTLLRDGGDPRRQGCPGCRRPLNLDDMLLVRDELFPSAGDLPTTAAAGGDLTGERLEDFRKISGFVSKFRLLEDWSGDDDGEEEEERSDDDSSICSAVTDGASDHRGDRDEDGWDGESRSLTDESEEEEEEESKGFDGADEWNWWEKDGPPSRLVRRKRRKHIPPMSLMRI